MKAGDIFYSVMQKDNCPFEQPRITKFVARKFLSENGNHYIVATKTDKLGRPYRFKENQIYFTYEDALVEKKKIIEKIEKWEQEKRERDRLYFEEQERKEKQRQLEHDNQIRKQVCDDIRRIILMGNGFWKFPEYTKDDIVEEILDYIQEYLDLVEKVEG
jgi:GTP-binding protein EngB required for normal cell division